MDILPKRSSKYGIGKEIGGAVYLHRIYEEQLGDVLASAKARLPTDFDYQVVKFDYRRVRVSFIRCTDFDSAPEPTVGEIVTVDATGRIRRRPRHRDPEIYHHKWLFVAENYEGFDMEASRRRALA